MGSGDSTCVKPQVVGPRDPECEPVIVGGVPTDEDLGAVCCDELTVGREEGCSSADALVFDWGVGV